MARLAALQHDQFSSGPHAANRRQQPASGVRNTIHGVSISLAEALRTQSATLGLKHVAFGLGYWRISQFLSCTAQANQLCEKFGGPCVDQMHVARMSRAGLFEDKIVEAQRWRGLHARAFGC